MKKKSAIIGAMALTGAIVLSAGTTSLAGSYTVVKGDSLWKIAKEKLGAGARYNEIFEVNKDKIKDPNKIQIGQVLVIPDGEPAPAPAPTPAPEAAPTPAPATPDPAPIASTFEEAFYSQMQTLIDDYNTLKPGESRTEKAEGIVTTKTMTAENVLVTENDISLDSALNSKIRTFSYKTETGYQVVVYFYGKNGINTYAVYNVTADGKDSSLMYLGLDSTGEDETLQISDILAGGKGYIEFVADTEGVISERRGKFIHMYDESGNLTADGYVARETVDNTTRTFATLENQNGDSIAVNYYTETADTTVHTIDVAVEEGWGVLSFETDAAGAFIPESVSFVPGSYDELSAAIESLESIDLFEILETGKGFDMTSLGLSYSVKRVSDDTIMVKISFDDKVIYQDFIKKSPEGLILQNIADSLK